MGFFPGRQRATTSPRTRSPKRGGGGRSRTSKPTPLKTSPALDPKVNAKRMAANKARGLGDSQGRSRTDPNFGKGPAAPRSQFRTTGGAALKSAKVKTRIVTRAEFQRSLAQKQQRSKAIRRFLKPLQEQRQKTGATERRRRIDAVTLKQRLIKEIKGQPLSELGRREKQATIDFIDLQFEPFLGRKKAVFTPGTAGKIEKNLGIFIQKKGVGEVKRKVTPKEFAKKQAGTVTRVEKKKGLAGVRQTIQKQRGLARQTVETDKSQIKRTFTGIVVLGALGLASGVIGVAEAIRNPIKTAKAQLEAIKNPRETIRVLGEEFTVDPVGTVAEFYAFGRTVNLGGRAIKRSPVGRFVQEELFIRSQPREIQTAVRRIIKASRIQEKLNPLKIKNIRKVDFFEVQSLNKLEAQALSRALKKTDSIVFGSWGARTLGGKKLPKPKDVDIATADINKFNRAFIKELPKEVRGNYLIKSQKVFRKVKSLKEASDKFGAKRIAGAIFDPIFDVKPINRLIPQKSLFTGRGRIPAVGFVKRIKGLERFKKIRRINEQIDKLRAKFKNARTKKSKAKLRKSLLQLQKQRAKELKKFSPSELLQLKKVPAVGGLDFPTGKIVEVGGIKVIGFGEQTVRKALGTLQVLIEKSPRRAKDPKSLLLALEVQRAALKRSKKLTLFKKRKLKILEDAIRLLKSKAFSKLLEKKVPGLTKEYPLVAKISRAALKKVKFAKVREEAVRKAKKAKLPITQKEKRKATKKKITKKTRATTKAPPRKPTKAPVKRVTRKKVSKTPKKKSLPKRLKKPKTSRLPKRKKPSRLPSSKLKRSKPSRLRPSRPSKLKPSKIKPSRIKSSTPSKIKPSKLKTSKISKSTTSKVPPSRLKPSRVPRGRPSKLTPSQIKSKLVKLPKGAPRPPPRLLKKPKTKKEEERLIRWVKRQRQIYRPSLAAILFDITGVPKKKLTGFEIRPIPVFRRVKRKVKQKPKKLKTRTSKRRLKKK